MLDRSKQEFERAQRSLPGGVNSAARAFGPVGGNPPIIASGERARIRDIDGNEYVVNLDTGLVGGSARSYTRNFYTGLVRTATADIYPQHGALTFHRHSLHDAHLRHLNRTHFQAELGHLAGRLFQPRLGFLQPLFGFELTHLRLLGTRLQLTFIDLGRLFDLGDRHWRPDQNRRHYEIFEFSNARHFSSSHF